MAYDADNTDGYFKIRYGEHKDLVPSWAVFTKSVPFRTQQRVGKAYEFPVTLRRPHGVTHRGGSNVRKVNDLKLPKSGIMENASVVGVEIAVQDDIAYGADAASKGDGAAFGDLMDEVTSQMELSAGFYKELHLLYGSKSIGEVLSITTAASGGVVTIRLTEGSWAAGIWSQLEGAHLDVYQSDLTTLRNTQAAPYASGTAVEVTAIDADTRDITLTGLQAEMAAIVAGDLLTPAGWIGNSMVGLDAHATNTGTLHGINAATYSLWRPNAHAAGASALSMNIVQSAVTKSVVRGLMGDVTVLTSPYSFTDLNNDLAALRRAASSMKAEMDNGTQAIKFYGVNGGSMSIVPHPMVKAGETFIYQAKHFKRVGSQDVSFKRPNAKPGEQQYNHGDLENSTGFRLRMWGDQGLIHCKPAALTKISGIDPASL